MARLRSWLLPSASVCLALLAPGSYAQDAAQTPLPAAPYPAPAPLAAHIQGLLATGPAAQAHWGIAVTALDGTPIYGLDEAKLFRPASTAKLFTTAAAMALLGPDARVSTTLTYTGSIGSNGALDGYLTLHGEGDANLAGATLTSPGDPLAVLDAFAMQVAALGIRSVPQVNVGGWLWEPYPEGWDTGDRLAGFAAPVTGLILNDNTQRLDIQPASTPGQPATVTLSPPVTHQNTLGTVYTAPPTVHGHILLRDFPGQLTILQIGGQVEGSKPVHGKVAVLDPASFAESALIDRLAAHGVSAAFHDPQRATSSDARPFDEIVNEPVALPNDPMAPDASNALSPQPLHAPSTPATIPPAPAPFRCNDGCTPLATHTSGPLAADVVLTLKQSLNLHAEAMLRRLGAVYGRDDSFAQGLRVARQFWQNAGIQPTDFIFYDGSGLSTRDLVTPRAEVQLLAYAARQPWSPQWQAALPVGGVDGTLASRFTGPLKGKVRAKTGTLGETRTLAGYLQCASGREVLFSIMEDGHLPNDSDTATLDRVVAAIAEAN